MDLLKSQPVTALGFRNTFLLATVLLAIFVSTPAIAAGGSVSQIGTGDNHSCALTTGGGVQCWGLNDAGQLGDGSMESRDLPVYVKGLEQNVVQLAVGGLHSCALLVTGTVKCWGENAVGQLGDASFEGSALPVDVSNLSQVLSISSGYTHSCALTTNGAAWCWGDNEKGQLGNNSTEESNQPVPVSGVGSNLQAITTGEYHSCGLDRSGDVHCWGENYYGQLGIGDAGLGSISQVPVPVPGLTDVKQVSAGGAHTCAVTVSGAAKCWGRNDSGQIGDSSFTLRSLPADVTGLGSGVALINSGYFHSCAITDAGEALCWGGNGAGELGNSNMPTDSNVPVPVTGLDSGVTDISGNDAHTCATTAGGGVQCWGYDFDGQLGNGNSPDSDFPVNVQGLNGLIAVATGNLHACAINTNGALQCWGENGSGQLGNQLNEDSDLPVLAAGFHSGVRAVAGGESSTCVITDEGAAWCWGDNTNGKLGNGSTEPSLTPVAVIGLDANVTSISVGMSHACAVQNGAAWCWGNGFEGQLGQGVDDSSDEPVPVSGLSSGVSAVSVGDSHSCALLDNGGVRCWGDNAPGQLGDGTNSDSNVPVTPTGITNANSMSSGGDHACAVLDDNTVRCWGRGSEGQLGHGIFGGSVSPVTVTNLTTAVSVELGNAHSCAILMDDTARCWGSNLSGRLGNGGGGNQANAVVVSNLNYVQALAAGKESTCALVDHGAVRCWGNNSSGQLANDEVSSSNEPINARGFNALQQVSTGGQHTCRLTADGAVACWGDNAYGQLGNGDYADSNWPVGVSGLGTITDVVAGVNHSCVRADDYTVSCWGDNGRGQLGLAAGGNSNTPVQIADVEALIITSGFSFNCAHDPGDAVQCWGANTEGQLGDHSFVDSHIPVNVKFAGNPFGTTKSLVSGYNHSCAIKNDVVYCWGSNQYGQLGVGDEVDRGQGTPITGLSNVTALSAGGYHTCALINGGIVKCWGRNYAGQLGTVNNDQFNTPQDVVGLSDAKAIVTGADHTCAITRANALKCWGFNGAGQLGNRTLFASNIPVTVIGLDSGVVAADGGEQHTCAITDTGLLKCWGWNNEGQVGDGTDIDRSVWAEVFPVKQMLDFTPPVNADSSQPLLLSAMASSGLDPGFDTWTDAKCAVAGDQLTPLAQGYCGVRARQMGNIEYAGAPAELRHIFILIEKIFDDGFETLH